ncbi:MAG: hypothetical protein AAF216_04105 [Pseudomonadota bacterium]
MFTVEFQTGALLMLSVTTIIISYILWANRADRKGVEFSTMEGVGHEMRINIQRFMSELAAISRNEPVVGGDLMDIHHPQLDAIYSQMVPANRNALSVIGATYQTLQARKNDLRIAARAGQDLSEGATPAAMDAVIDAIVTLYLWEEHGGARPADAPSTRTWHVRAWMKSHGITQDVFPDMYLRDEVVERLRQYGMILTPRPLTHTAAEFYAKRYDRKADRNAPMWTRKEKPAEPELIESNGGRAIREGEQVVIG